MALDSTRIPAYGPFTVAFFNSASPNSAITRLNNASPAVQEPFVWTGLKSDSVTVSLETKEQTLEFEDGSEVFWEEGRVLNVEIVCSELHPADMDKLETAKGMTITFTQTGKVITIVGTATASSIVSIDGLKTKLVYRKPYGAGTTIANVMSIA